MIGKHIIDIWSTHLSPQVWSAFWEMEWEGGGFQVSLLQCLNDFKSAIVAGTVDQFVDSF